jgi:hypothetical protein
MSGSASVQSAPAEHFRHTRRAAEGDNLVHNCQRLPRKHASSGVVGRTQPRLTRRHRRALVSLRVNTKVGTVGWGTSARCNPCVTLRGDSLRRRPGGKLSGCHLDLGSWLHPGQAVQHPTQTLKSSRTFRGHVGRDPKKLSWITTRNDLSWRHESQDQET